MYVNQSKSAAQSAPVQPSVMTVDESAALKRDASALQVAEQYGNIFGTFVEHHCPFNQINFFQARIRALEMQNAALLSQISARRSQDIDVIQD
jgi:hypothetical protein